MTLKLAAPSVGVVGSLAAFIAYLVVSNLAAASWAGISALFASALAWDLWKNR